MILSASTFNSCMIEFSIPDFNETIIEIVYRNRKSLQHEPKASDVITLVKKTFFARVSYEILYPEV